MSICNAPLPPFAVESSERSGSIKNLPINLFGAVMGLAADFGERDRAFR